MTKEKIEATVGHEDAFDVEKALNEAGFSEFLGKHPDFDTFDTNDAAFMSKKYETFKQKKFVAEQTQSVFKDYIEKQVGLPLEVGSYNSIPVGMDQVAVENPAAVKSLEMKFATFANAPEEITALESRLAELGNKEELVAQLQTKKNIAETAALAKDYSSKFGKLKVWISIIDSKIKHSQAYALRRPRAAERHTKDAEDGFKKIEAFKRMALGDEDIDREKVVSILETVTEEIKTIEDTLGKIKEAEEMKTAYKEMFSSLRKDLLSGVKEYDVLTKEVQKKVVEQLGSMIKKGDVRSLDAAQKRVDELREVNAEGLTGIDLFKGLEGINLNEGNLQLRLDALILMKANEEVEKAVKETQLGTNAYTQMERALLSWMQREKIGSREGEEAKDTVKTIIKNVSDALPDSTQGRAKKILLARILTKIK